MSVWIDFCVYVALQLAVWSAPLLARRRFGPAKISARNPDWPAAHPQAAQALVKSGSWGVVASLLCLAAVSLLAVVAANATPAAAGWRALRNASVLLLALAIVFNHFAWIGFMIRLKSVVPLAARRQASLHPRSIEARVPRAMLWALNAIVGAHLLGWLVIGFSRGSDTFWVRFVIITLSSGFIASIHWRAARRSIAEESVGPAFREERASILATLFLQLVFGSSLYEAAFGAPGLDTDRLFYLFLAVVTVLIVQTAVRRRPRTPTGIPA